MSSSFQAKSDLEMEDVFQNVSALYCLLKQGEPHALRRAELKQGVVPAEATDFIADYEMRCRRVLNSTQYRLVLKYVSEERYQSVPKSLQQLLGKLFLETDMDASGAYRILFFKAKNARLQDYEQGLQFPEGDV
jgi:hypothetical protein